MRGVRVVLLRKDGVVWYSFVQKVYYQILYIRHMAGVPKVRIDGHLQSNEGSYTQVLYYYKNDCSQ